MVEFILGLIAIAIGIVVGIVLKKHTVVETVTNSDFTKTKVDKKPFKKYATIPIAAGIILGCLGIFLGSIVSVTTGNTGVVSTFGKVENYTLESGFHFKAPWNTVTEMDNRVQKQTIEMKCFSSDIQEVSMKYTLNYQIDRANAQEIYKTIGKDYYSTIIEPNITEAVKVASAQYTAEKLVQTRSELADDIEKLLRENLNKYHINVSSTAIEDMDFTDAFTNAVEAKQVAEQKKKQAEIEQSQQLAQAENDKKIAETKAKAEAEVAKIKAEADMEVAKIEADTAEYAGQKNAAIALQGLASTNGWTVVTYKNPDGASINKLLKSDGEVVTQAELEIGVKNYLEKLKNDKWDGKLPVYYLGSDGSITTVIPTPGV